MKGKRKSGPRSRTVVPQQDDDLQVAYHAVAFFDLLGQASELLMLQDLPDSKAGREALVACIRRTVGVVEAFRKTFTDFYESYTAIDTLEQQVRRLPPPKSAVLPLLQRPELRFTHFSDATVISVPLVNTHQRLSLRAVTGLFTAAAATMTYCAVAGIPVRGALDVGVGCVLPGGDFYGRPLATTVSLEKCADWPRVLVGDDALSFLEFVASSTPTDAVDRVNKGLALEVLSWIFVDIDKRHGLDYLGSPFSRIAHDQVAARRADALVATAKKLSSFDVGDKRRQKYERLESYIKSRLTVEASA
jgi:hypothetical protein